MLKYLRHTEVSVRFGLNPFNWKWIPAVAYDPPSPIYPKRRTFAFAFLFLQAFLDVDDGTHDEQSFKEMIAGAFGNENLEVYDEQSDVGHTVSPFGEGDIFLEQGPKH